MSRNDTIALLGLCTASLCGFVALGSWWSAGDSPSQAWRARDNTGLAMLENKARSEPGNIVNFTRLGEAYKASGLLREAVSAYVSAAELAPRNPEVQRALISLKAMAEAKGRH
jgi:cytochrome c-type biogenesis protein CcmH/NrfG